MKNERILGIVFIFVMIPLLALVLLSTVSLSSFQMAGERPSSFNTGWTFTGLSKSIAEPLVLPEVIKNIPANAEFHLSNTLPEIDAEEPTMFFKTEQQYVTVLINHQTAYEFKPENKGFGHSPGSAIHFVKLPADSKGSTVDIFLTSPYKSFSGIISDVYLGSRSSHILRLIKQGTLPLIVSMTILFLGVVLFVAFVTLHMSGLKNSGVLYLALFCFFSGIWMASESKLLLLFYDDPVVFLNIALISLYCMPVSLLLFVNRNYCLKYRRAVNYVTLVYIIFISAVLLLQIFNLSDFVLALPIFHLISVLAIIVIGFATLREILRGNVKIRIFFAGCVTFSACVLGDMALYYFSVLPQMGFHGISLIGNLLFILITTSSLGENLFQIRDMQTRNKILLSMAYTDGLTGLKNRSSFDEEVNELGAQLELERSIHLIVLDINNLKKINDTLGHREGDRLITDGADILRKTFGKMGEIYRVGGDEFSIIVRNRGAAEINDVISELFEEIDHYNKISSSFKISIAYGLASFKKGIDHDLNNVFIRADKAMYNCKVNQKQIQVID